MRRLKQGKARMLEFVGGRKNRRGRVGRVDAVMDRGRRIYLEAFSNERGKLHGNGRLLGVSVE